MIYHTEYYGFESEDLDALTEELTRVLEMTPRLSRSDALGSDLTAFGDEEKPGGSLRLYHNHTHDGVEPIVQRRAHPKMGSILRIVQIGSYVDYAPKLERIEGFETVLLQRRRYDSDTREREILFDLAKEEGRDDAL